MCRHLGAVIAVMVAIAASSAAGAEFEVLELRSGHKLEGEVLKESAEALFVDVGVTVLRVPTDQVLRRYAPSAEGKAQEEPEQKDGIYRTSSSLSAKSVKDLTQQYGEAVVMVQTPSGLGSGFIINESGYCVTNYHVIEQETRIAVVIYQKTDQELRRRRIDDVRIVALNPFVDLAILQIPEQSDLKFKYVYLAKQDRVRAGDPVFAIGNPQGLERSVSQGIVSMRNRNVGGLTYLQTTTEINPGNSGGPLFNLSGEVVGVTNMKQIFSEGLGFAIPVSYVKHFLENRDAFAFSRDNPNAGYRYLDPPRRRRPEAPPTAESSTGKGE
jgi:serine protease Do